MRLHCFQHESFEGLAFLQNWFEDNGFIISYTRFFESCGIPSSGEIDWLVIMGGPMSVNDEDAFPWLAAEKEFIRNFIKSGKPVIGICLGSQLIASALGAKVYANKEKEIGWFPVTKLKGVSSPLFDDMPGTVTVFHWHGETFDLPEGAVCIAGSEACAHQIFQYGQKTIGFQCHPETTEESLRAIIGGCSNEIADAPYIQKADKMMELFPKYCEPMHEILCSILDKLIRL